MRTLFPIAIFLIFLSACTKQDVSKQIPSAAADSIQAQINYLAKIKANLDNSLSKTDFSTIDFNKVYKSNDVRTKNYFIRLSFQGKKISDDFVLLRSDNVGNIINGKIVHIERNKNKKLDADVTVVASSLDRKNVRYLKNLYKKKKSSSNKSNSEISTSSNVSSLMEEEEPVGEQTLPDVVVTGYIYDDPAPYYWYCFDDILGTSTGGGGTYTYGASDPYGGGGGGTTYSDETIDINYENADQSPIDVSKYIKCFSSLSNVGATFKITIYSDIPVNSNPNDLFDFSTGAVGHTFLQLSKTNGDAIIQQNIGFYPETGWKSIANSPVTSKLVDNAGHEFNASLTITVDATRFQNALNKMQAESTMKYDMDDFNCTDYALSVFNAAAPTYLSIPGMHIPNGTFGTTSNTPQGLYIELSNLSKAGGYPGAQISIPNTASKAGASHGACN